MHVQNNSIHAIQGQLNSLLKGRETLVEFALACFLARGHLLLEGPPGTGKTLLAKSFAQVFGGSFRRIQMTSDLLPSDVTGILRIKPQSNEFEFRPGPLFANIVLADELNRTTPKTQGALLEAMEESTVTVDGKTYPLPDPFFVIATQNPLEFHGVYPLAESQLDRFMMKLDFSYLDRESEASVYQNPELFLHSQMNKVQTHILPEQVSSLIQKSASIHIEKTVTEYVTILVRETRNLPQVSHGVSVRGGIQLIHAAKSLALIRQREFVIPQDIVDLAVPCLAHRLLMHSSSQNTQTQQQLILDLIEKIPQPK